MKTCWGVLALFLFMVGGATAEDIVVHSSATTESRDGKPWTKLSAVVETTTDCPFPAVVAAVTDWASYARIFSKVKAASVVRDGSDVLLSETTEVTVLGFSVTNRFTLRIATSVDAATGAVVIRWTQEATDGTINGLEGGWDLVPVSGAGRVGAQIRYRSSSSVPQSFFGEDGVLSLFLPGEMKQVVAQVLAEARQKKETP